MAEQQEHQPGTHAPVTGHYEELNVFGTRTGRVKYVREGERLPEGPRCFTWRQVEEGLPTSDREAVRPGERPMLLLWWSLKGEKSAGTPVAASGRPAARSVPQASGRCTASPKPPSKTARVE